MRELRGSTTAITTASSPSRTVIAAVGAELVRKTAQLGQHRLLQPWRDPAAQLDEPDAEAVASVREALHESLVEKRGEQPVDTGTVRVELGGELGDAETVGMLGENVEQSQAAPQRQRTAGGRLPGRALAHGKTVPGPALRHELSRD